MSCKVLPIQVMKEAGTTMLKRQSDLVHMVQQDGEMMNVLKCAKELQLPDWWVCAGFLRSKIWDVLHGFSNPTELADVDVIYFDQANTSKSAEKYWEDQLRQRMPYIPWSVKNQARMHKVNGVFPYTSSEHAISKFPETATALGIKITPENKLKLAAPWGVEDAFQMIVRPTPFFQEREERMKIYQHRVTQKNWKGRWEKITVIY